MSVSAPAELSNRLEIIERKASAGTSSPPILFVHGAWHGAWCWAEYFMPYFAERGLDCYAFSMRGHGQSPCDRFFHLSSVDHYVSDLSTVVRELGKAPILVGHSMGGLVVQRYLEDNRVPAAVLLASVPPRGILRFAARMAARHPGMFVKFLLTMNPRRAVETRELACDLFFSPEISDDELDRYYSMLGTESERGALEMMTYKRPRASRVRAGGTPVLVLGAERDIIFLPGEVRATARRYGVRPEFFDMAHDMMLEAGWQAVADRIIDWLAEAGLWTHS